MTYEIQITFRVMNPLSLSSKTLQGRSTSFFGLRCYSKSIASGGYLWRISTSFVKSIEKYKW